jgi:diadenosine tetraphosphate (Ap4A) HIT family hydrolase
MEARPCPFCSLLADSSSERGLRAQSDHAAAFDDTFPSAPGHVLVVPRRHVGRVSELTDSELVDLITLARNEAVRLDASSQAGAAYTFGINDGAAAGQTVPHVHMHVIPRNLGDNPAPRGGIRHVIPDTAVYWDRY